MSKSSDTSVLLSQHQAKVGRIKGLDGIRTIAVFLVILAHNFYFKFHVDSGGAGVRLFFVLSGFLIISILNRRRVVIEEGKSTVRREVVHFFENRVFRIWPIYFATLFVSLITVTARTGNQADPASWMGNALFMGNVLVAYVWHEWRQVGVFWSVGVEEQFYLWAGLALLLAGQGWHKAICWGALALAVIVAVATPAFLPDPEAARLSIDLGSFTNFGLIAMGGLASLAMQKNAIVHWATVPSLLVYLLCTFTGLPSWMDGSAAFFLPAVLVMIVLSGIAHNQDSMLVKVLEFWPISYLGRISYGIYLFHTLVRFAILPMPTWFDDHATFKALAETSLSIGLASLSWHYFEKPILDFRDRRRQRQADSRLGAVPAF
ncbi:acyltransferase [Novosphingobium sp. CECT 9465]|uniref:acyltransferase family protein n=1 Tax=Novosphingobium sp. CECT 9465 TaxID=2829794 RepID=UPI001E322C03|nr:acyltransferase [Novosphingobium sp. CECT 9465]CAH0495542.1 hypothetical protein NVSP9465_00549 [Novosphingobium sp. CECT 9465]